MTVRAAASVAVTSGGSRNVAIPEANITTNNAYIVRVFVPTLPNKAMLLSSLIVRVHDAMVFFKLIARLLSN